MRKNKIIPNNTTPESSQKTLVHLNAKEDTKGLDQRLLQGPLAERGCTDILCLLLFIISIGILIYISQQGYQNGQPERLIAVYDADGKACGIDYKEYPYLYFAIPFGDYFNRTTCVKDCPVYSDATSKPTTLNCQTNQLVTSCSENCNILTSLTDLSNFNAFATGDLSFLSSYVCVFNTTMYFGKVCSPTQLLSVFGNSNSYTKYLNLDAVTAYVQDLDKTRQAIYCSFGVAFILGICYLFLTRILAGILVWASILLYFIGLGFGTYWCYQQDQFYQSVQNDQTGKYTYEQVSKAKDNQLAFMYLTYIMYGIIALSIIGFLCIYKKIKLAIAIIKTAAIFVKDQFLIILVPPITGIFIAALWFWWIYTAIYVYSLGEIKGTGNSPFATVTHTQVQSQYFWYFIFGGLWKNAFIQAINNFVIASTCCIWYFTQNGMGGGNGAIRRSLYWAFRYHAGSLAFGSLLLAIVQFIRIILEYVRYQTEKMGGSENKCTKCILKCLSCLMACFERFIRFLTNNAYIMIALTGKSFCPAAKDAFETIWANSMRFSLVSGLGGVFIFIGKFCISITTTMIFYYVITSYPYFSDGLFSPILPCIIVLIIAYAISVIFMTIYGMACDSVLLCFIYDEELNKLNGGQSAQHCPETLREFMELPDMVGLKQA